MPDPKSGNQPMNGPAQVQCPYLANATMAVMQINPARHREKGDWQESIHLSGAVYYYNDKTRRYMFDQNDLNNRSTVHGTIYCCYNILDPQSNERNGHRAGHCRQRIETLARPNGMMLSIEESHKVIMNTSTTMVNPRCQKNIYVDGLMNEVDVRGFMDDFIAQAKSQTTVENTNLFSDRQMS
ncbi:hypothetical protein BD769DRAFT_1385606 [Suillus cothurnatus]|nr:hypothetical protein BD769DRAFT_1385606 [Suillus cothurnatus]